MIRHYIVQIYIIHITFLSTILSNNVFRLSNILSNTDIMTFIFRTYINVSGYPFPHTPFIRYQRCRISKSDAEASWSGPAAGCQSRMHYVRIRLQYGSRLIRCIFHPEQVLQPAAHCIGTSQNAPWKRSGSIRAEAPPRRRIGNDIRKPDQHRKLYNKSSDDDNKGAGCIHDIRKEKEPHFRGKVNGRPAHHAKKRKSLRSPKPHLIRSLHRHSYRLWRNKRTDASTACQKKIDPQKKRTYHNNGNKSRNVKGCQGHSLRPPKVIILPKRYISDTPALKNDIRNYSETVQSSRNTAHSG